MTDPAPPYLFRYDYVEVRDGVDESGQLVGKYCGKIAPSPVVSSGNQLFIKFVSDYETHGAGFSIRYEIFKTGGWRLHCTDTPDSHTEQQSYRSTTKAVMSSVLQTSRQQDQQMLEVISPSVNLY